MMDKVFPLKTYSGRQRRVLRPKPATETWQQLASKKNESGSDNVKNVKNTPMTRRSSSAPKSSRKKRLKSPRTRSTTRGQRKKSKNKNPSKTRKGSVKEQNLTFGMFGIDGECRADDLTSQGNQAETSPAVGRKNNIDLNESKKETHTLPDSVMGGQDKVSEWLSTQNKDGDSPVSTPDGGRCGESADCSIEVMREEVVTAAERKEKHFGGKFFENINKVVNIASGLAQKSHKKPATPNISIEDIDIVDSPVTEKTAGKSAHLQLLELQPSTEIGTEICTTGPTTRRSSGMVPTSTRRSSAMTGMEPSTELGTYTMTRSSAITAKGTECSTQWSSVMTGIEPSTELGTYTMTRSAAITAKGTECSTRWSSTMTGMEPSTELGTYTMTRSAAIIDTGTCTSSTGRRSSATRESTDYCTDEVTESLAEKEKSEKTPGKQTSFAVPGSPLKKQKVKPSRKRSEGEVPRSSTRLFQTNIDQTETVPPEFNLSSIHGDAERGKFMHSEVSSGTGDVKQPIPLTPEIQIINRQPVPRLTSTPNRKTSTPNNDGYQPAQFEIDLSSVSAVHSDEEGLILHQVSRDVLSDEHMDLSKTRIDENFGDQQPVNIDFGHDEISKSSRQVRSAVNKKGKKAMSDSEITLKYCRKLDSGKRKQITKGPILRRKSSSFNASSNTSQNRTNKEISKAIMSHQSELAETCTSGKQASPRQNLFRLSTNMLSSDRHVSSVRYPHKGLPSKSFKSTFRLKMKSPNQKKTRTGPKVKENLPFCDLDGDFACPRRETEKIRIHRDNKMSFGERVAALPRDDLKFCID